MHAYWRSEEELRRCAQIRRRPFSARIFVLLLSMVSVAYPRHVLLGALFPGVLGATKVFTNQRGNTCVCVFLCFSRCQSNREALVLCGSTNHFGCHGVDLKYDCLSLAPLFYLFGLTNLGAEKLLVLGNGA